MNMLTGRSWRVNMKKELLAGAALALLLAGCGNANTGVTEEGASASDSEGKGVTNIAEVKHDDATTKAEVTKVDGKVTGITIDEIDKDGVSKKDLGDKYGWKSASAIEKEWYEQVEFLENYILENGVDSIKMNDQGQAENEDLKSGCTISISNMVEAVKEAEAK